MTPGEADQRKLTLAGQQEVVTTLDTFHRGEISRYDAELVAVLRALDLPTNGILAEARERGVVLKNLPDVLDKLPPDRRNEADYLARFVAAVGAGLFDAGLNFLWDATIANLRDRVANFDLSYFYDVLFTDPTVRSRYKTTEDLAKIDDWQLISGCRDIGLLDDLGFRHLSFIRDMRNIASAAHPSEAVIDGLSLVTWLQACIRHVLALPADASAVRIKKLLGNIRTNVLKPGDEASIVAALPSTPDEQADSLLKALFGIYTDPGIPAPSAANVDLLAAPSWKRASEEARRWIGQKYYLISADADVPRREAARRFLQRVEGLSYVPQTVRAAEMSTVLDDLRKAHNGFGNFNNEPPHAKALIGYVAPDGSVPSGVQSKYVRTVLLSLCGNFYNVSWEAESYLDPLLDKFSDAQITEFVLALEDRDLAAETLNLNPRVKYQVFASRLAKRTTDARLKNALSLIGVANKDDFKDGTLLRKVRDALKT